MTGCHVALSTRGGRTFRGFWGGIVMSWSTLGGTVTVTARLFRRNINIHRIGSRSVDMEA